MHTLRLHKGSSKLAQYNFCKALQGYHTDLSLAFVKKFNDLLAEIGDILFMITK